MRAPATAAYDVLAGRGAVLEAELLEFVVAVVEERRLVERATDAALADGRLQRAVERALESSAVADVAAQVAESEAVSRVVSSVVRSPELLDALQEQSSTLATELADQLRARTARVDNTLEGVARRLIRRRAAADPVVHIPVESA